jgi:hypothetical protein
MFDRAFFRGPNWSEHVRRYAEDNGYESVSVRITTVLGEKFDVQRCGGLTTKGCGSTRRAAR